MSDWYSSIESCVTYGRGIPNSIELAYLNEEKNSILDLQKGLLEMDFRDNKLDILTYSDFVEKLSYIPRKLKEIGIKLSTLETGDDVRNALNIIRSPVAEYTIEDILKE